MREVRVLRVVYAIGDARLGGTAVGAVSTFDGVHTGHRRLAERAAALAGARGVSSAAVVLWEGERGGDAAPGGLLTLLDERLRLLADLDRFDAALVISRAPDAPAPVPDALLGAIERVAQPVALLVADEPGTPPLAEAATRRGIRLVQVRLDGEDTDEMRPDAARDPERTERHEHLEHKAARERTPIDEAIAGALLAGDVRAATRLLGHPYGVRGEVVGGDRRGRVLGFPTANLRLDARKFLPADGIYAVRVGLPGEPEARHPAVASLGVRPQFGSGKPRLLEVFLLDAALDLYGLPLEVAFVERLREERRFADVEALKVQMARDVQVARDVLNTDGGTLG
jgi:riboflavin kinase/FMN adenylyltransferase